jgi:hypothetical protein
MSKISDISTSDMKRCTANETEKLIIVNFLVNPCIRIHFEKLIVTKLVEELSTVCGMFLLKKTG